MALVQRRNWLAYFAALLGIGAATAIRFALHPVLGEHLIFSVYYLAVTLAAWSGGIRPALITAVLSSLLANFLFSEPVGSLRFNNVEELCAFAIFLSVSTVIGVLSEFSLQSQARARAAEQQKDDFLAILAHQLRNPLAIIHYTNLAEKRDGLREGRAKIIDSQVQQLDEMIEGLLDITRVSRGRFQLEAAEVTASAVVDEAVQKVRFIVESRQQELVLRRCAQELMLWGDPTRLVQILTNLLINAARQTPKGGKIELVVDPEEGCAVFRVRDNGNGIPKEVLGRVFDLHTQVERALDSTGSGIGIGLTLVRSLAELHGGSVSASSEGENRGSEFVVRLPLRQKT